MNTIEALVRWNAPDDLTVTEAREQVRARLRSSPDMPDVTVKAPPNTQRHEVHGAMVTIASLWHGGWRMAAMEQVSAWGIERADLESSLLTEFDLEQLTAVLDRMERT